MRTPSNGGPYEPASYRATCMTDEQFIARFDKIISAAERGYEAAQAECDKLNEELPENHRVTWRTSGPYHNFQLLHTTTGKVLKNWPPRRVGRHKNGQNKNA
jgi:hypothetical protein